MDQRNTSDVLDFFLGYCETELHDDRLILRSGNEFPLTGLSKCWRETLIWANAYYQRSNVFLHKGDDNIPLYKLPAWLFAIEAQQKQANLNSGVSRMNQNQNPEEQATGIDILRPYLVERSEFEVLDFVKERIGEGLIVIITSQIDDRCRFTSKSLTPERAFWTPSQFINYDYTRSWDIDRVGHPYEGYYTMRDLLERDGHVLGFNYKLRRPGDEALVAYSTDYYHVRDGWCGEPVRIGVSRPQDYRVIQVPEPQAN